MSNKIVYHHTSLAHLPFIIEAGELVGTRGSKTKKPNQLLAWPNDFVWATENQHGDLTVGVNPKKNRTLPRVRISFDDDLFMSDWEALAKLNDWTDAHVNFLIEKAKQVGQPTDIWYATRGPLPLVLAQKVEIKFWESPKWREIERLTVNESDLGSDKLRFTLFDKFYLSQRVETPAGKMYGAMQIKGPRNAA